MIGGYSMVDKDLYFMSYEKLKQIPLHLKCQALSNNKFERERANKEIKKICLEKGWRYE